LYPSPDEAANISVMVTAFQDIASPSREPENSEGAIFGRIIRRTVRVNERSND